MSEDAYEQIPGPKSNGDVPRFLSAVSKHRDVLELGYRLTGLEAEVLARGGRDVTQWSSLRHGSLAHLSKIRREKHNEIVSDLLQDGSRCTGGDPLAVILLGPPGAGKTSCGVLAAKNRFGVPFTSVNSDDVKEKLPEYEGWNAGPLHEESTYIAESMIRTQAVNSRCNIIYDITGRKAEKVMTAIEYLAEFRYGVYLVLVDLPPWRAVRRVWERFQINPFGRIDPNQPGGRYVSPDYVYSKVGLLPRKTFGRIKKRDTVKGFCRLDANQPQSAQPAVVETGKEW